LGRHAHRILSSPDIVQCPTVQCPRDGTLEGGKTFRFLEVGLKGSEKYGNIRIWAVMLTGISDRISSDDSDSTFDHASLDWDKFEQDVVPPSPLYHAMSDLDDFGDESGNDSAPSSPSW
jgi:hypothetical protein